jgi:hypothetical protein
LVLLNHRVVIAAVKVAAEVAVPVEAGFRVGVVVPVA